MSSHNAPLVRSRWEDWKGGEGCVGVGVLEWWDGCEIGSAEPVEWTRIHLPPCRCDVPGYKNGKWTERKWKFYVSHFFWVWSDTIPDNFTTRLT